MVSGSGSGVFSQGGFFDDTGVSPDTIPLKLILLPFLFRALAVVLFVTVILWCAVMILVQTTATSTNSDIIQHQYLAAMNRAAPIYDLFPWFGELSHAYGRALLNVNHFNRAALVLQNTQRFKANYFVNLQLAICYESTRNWQKAEAEYRYVIAYATRSDPAIEGLIRVKSSEFFDLVIRHRGELPTDVLSRSLASLKRLLELKTPPPRSLIEALACIDYLLDDRESLMTLENMYATSGITRWSALWTIEEYIQIDDWTKALQLSDHLIAANTGFVPFLMILHREISSAFPASSDADARRHITLARIFQSTHQPDATRRELEMAIALDSANPIAREMLESLQEQPK